MQNKNSIKSTIIGIAVLLVLVVGATYAYIYAVVSNDDGETLILGKTDSVGTVTLSNPTSDLKLKVTAKDMLKNKLGTYYATTDSTLNYDTEEIQRNIAVATLFGGESSLNYKCSMTVNIVTEGTMLSFLNEGDIYVQFGGLLTNKVDLTNVSSEGYTVDFNLNNTYLPEQYVSASVALVNKNTNQNDLAGKSLAISFQNTNFSCEVIEATNETVNTSDSVIALQNSYGLDLMDYKIYGNSIQNGTPTPTNPVEVESVGDYDEETGKYVIPVTTRGKNIFDPEWFMSTNGEWIQGSYYRKYIQLKPNTTYTINSYIPEDTDPKPTLFVANYSEAYDGPQANGNWASTTGNRKATFTTDATGLIIVKRIIAWNVTDQTITDFFNSPGVQIQLEEGSVATDYEPYIEPVTTNIYLDAPLRKVGGTSDYIDFTNKKIVRNIAKIELVGTENWSTFSSSGVIYTHVRTKKMGDLNLISNYFPTFYSSASDNNSVSGRSNNTAVAFSVGDSVATTKEEWISWLEIKNNSGNSLIVQYELETAIEETIELPPIPTFEGTTFIEIGTSIKPNNVDITYSVDISK